MHFFTSLFEFLKNTKRIIHILVFVACMCISAYQLAECLKKLRQPPVSTHYRFVINDSLNYPAVTICRNPPYKPEILQYYNLGLQNSSVEHTSEWQNFPFKTATLQQVWDNATYTKDEVIKMYGLHGQSANAEIIQRYYFLNGRCFTFIPRVGAKQPWPNSGWSITLKYNDKKPMEYHEDNGYHVYVHETREPWTENLAQTKYIMQYLHLGVGEEIEVKLNADEFKGISTCRRPCISDINYSKYKCLEQHWWTNISRSAGCTVPWMRGVEGLPHCNNYDQLFQLLQSYTNFTDLDDPVCIHHPCNVTAYKLQVVKRKSMVRPFSHLYLYYTSKMVTVMQELHGYDANTFLSDLGGSLGFFLGLSVIGALELLEKTWGVVRCLAKGEKVEKDEEKDMEKMENETKIAEKY